MSFSRPLHDGAVVWRFPKRTDAWRPERAYAVGQTPGVKWETVFDLDAVGRWLLITQLDGLWAIRVDDEKRFRLEVPEPASRRLPRPMGVLMGERVVVLAGDQLGVFDLTGR